MAGEIYVQYGAGLCCPDGWINFDASPTLRAQRIPLLGNVLVPKARRFPDNLRFGDIVLGLPIAEDSANGVYASHILEHLALEDFRIAIRNTLRLLKPGRTFRCIVPDLAERARRYVTTLTADDSEASLAFMRACHLGCEKRPRSVIGKLRRALGSSGHLWMWDEWSMKREFNKAGFTAVRRCCFGDADDPMFSRVESYDRFVDAGYTPEIHEIAIEAKKPA